MKKKRFLWSLTAMAALLTAAACSDDLAEQGGSPAGGSADGEEVEVSFTISTEDAARLTRAVRAVKDDDDDASDDDNPSGGPGWGQPSIGKGKKIDALIYAVYDSDYNLLKQYGQGLVGVMDEAGVATTQPFASADAAPAFADAFGADGSVLVTARSGQTIVNVDGVFNEGEPYTFTLRLMRGRTYHLAFWAQSSQTTAFDTKDLEKVTVDYASATNNDELRDAFCKVETFSVSAPGQSGDSDGDDVDVAAGETSNRTRSIILRRPMAQINVGTTGADYANFVKGEFTYPNRRITYSKVELDGAANQIDVVRDKISTVESFSGKVTFDWAPIAAYIDKSIPTEDGELINYAKDLKKEEFLYVDLDNDGGFKPYKYRYPTREEGENGNYLTETFKYLSMCYVLVPATKISEKTPDGNEIVDHYNKTVLNSLKVYFAEEKNGTADIEEGEEYAYVSLTEIPAQRNWRTNILGGLYYTKQPHDPDDPDTPDDPTSVFNLTVVLVERDPAFIEDYYNEGGYDPDENGDVPSESEWVQNTDPNADSGTDEP